MWLPTTRQHRLSHMLQNLVVPLERDDVRPLTLSGRSATTTMCLDPTRACHTYPQRRLLGTLLAMAGLEVHLECG